MYCEFHDMAKKFESMVDEFLVQNAKNLPHGVDKTFIIGILNNCEQMHDTVKKKQEDIHKEFLAAKKISLHKLNQDNAKTFKKMTKEHECNCKEIYKNKDIYHKCNNKNDYDKKYKYENEITILLEDFQDFKKEYTQLFGIGFRDDSNFSKMESEVIDAVIYNMYSLGRLLNLHKEIIKNKKCN